MLGRLLAVIVAVGLGAAGCGGGDDENAVTPSSGRSASVWVGRAGSEELVRLDQRGKVRATIELGAQPRSIAVTDDSVWVATSTGRVLRVDKQSNEVVAEIQVGGQAGALGADEDHVWVAVDARDLVRISTDTNERSAVTAIGSAGAPLVDVDVGEGWVWVLLDFQLALVQVDPATGRVVGRLPLCGPTECRVGASASGTGVAGGSVWVVDSTASEILAIDADSLEVRERAPLETGIWYVVAGDEGVFLVDVVTGVLQRIALDDLSSRDVASESVELPGAVALGAGSVWIYDSGRSEVVRVDAATLDRLTGFSIEGVSVLAVG